MKEINIARTLTNKRKEKGITQSELASYMGVSKASVSKWESGQSYPDITFLPQLAAFFDISIDDLMGYEPQMTKEDIRILYQKLHTEFSNNPLEEVLSHCRTIVKKYFSCYPLLFQIGVLLLNYHTLSNVPEKSREMIEEAKEIFTRVKKESDDMELAKQALNMEGMCLLSLGKADEVLSLLGESRMSLTCTETIVASAYQMTGKAREAKTVLQVGIYQHIIGLFDFGISYFMLCADDKDRFEESYRRILAVADTFHIKTLHPVTMINFYLAAAQGYMALGKKDCALDNLQKYYEIATSDIYPLHLHGDAYFDLIEEWLDDLILGPILPRDEKTVRQSIMDGVEQNPAFASLCDEERFKDIVNRLKNSLKGKG